MVWIYHERQNSNLCGLHAINNLFQSKKFDRGTMDNLARQIDRQEQALGLGGLASNNYDSTGNYSVQVLTRALQNETLELRNIGEETMRDQRLETFEGFICHREAHWIAIRKIGEKFWNLNSFLEYPQPINSYVLVTQIATLRNNNYTVFVALPQDWQAGGKLPPISGATPSKNIPKLKYWWNGDKLLEKASGNDTLNFASAYGGGQSGWSYEDVKQTVVEHEANATKDAWINMSGAGAALVGGSKTAKKTFDELERDQYEKLELREITNGNTKLKIKVGRQGKPVSVDKDDSVRYLYALALSLCKEFDAANVNSGKQLQLLKARKREVLTDLDQTIEEAGLARTLVTCSWV